MPFEDMDAPFLSKMIHVNIQSHLTVTQMILPLMKKNKNGLILNMGSMAGVVPSALNAVYRYILSYLFY